jgi:hypothetical protein|tara:strand:- start:723 stop:923 length:201 start_codon:yes stop_codon:yes gene_type:complete
VGAVEQVLSQHPGLVEKWDQKRFNAQCYKHQSCILKVLVERPEYHRSDFQQATVGFSSMIKSGFIV